MNKNKIIIWVIIAIVVIGGIVGYLLFSHKSGTVSQAPTSSANNSTGNSNSQTQATNGPTSLNDLLASGAAQSCTYSDVSGAVSSQGTVYIGQGKMRLDYSTLENGQNITGHMIADGQYYYTWMDGSSSGFKFAPTANQQVSPQPNQNSQSIDTNKKIDYNCAPWSPDSSLFVLPSKVQFNDLNSAIPQIPQGQTQTPPGASATPISASGSPSLKSAQCSACDSAPASARAACLQALGCQ